MKLRFSNEVISRILEQSVFYTCVCPAQICKAIKEQRALYTYQTHCLNMTDTDKAVHKEIADTVEFTHAKLEECLEKVLLLEGWDMETYQTPSLWKDKIIGELEDALKDGIEK